MGKGSGTRPQNVSNEIHDKKFTDIFGTEYCFNCKKVCTIQKVRREGIMKCVCQRCLLIIRVETVDPTIRQIDTTIKHATNKSWIGIESNNYYKAGEMPRVPNVPVGHIKLPDEDARNTLK